MSVTLKGVQEMVANLQMILDKTPLMVEKALYQEAQIEVVEMKKRCPVDVSPHAPHPGNLRASIHAEEPTRDGRHVEVIVATGIQAPYAIYVHENPYAHHVIGEWKFMESVLNESAPYMLTRVSDRINFNQYKNTAEYMNADSSSEE
jgi:hypothetical protein